MHWKAFILLLAIVTNFSVSMRANSGEINVQTRQMNIKRRHNGDTYINTERIQLSVPSSRSRLRHYPHSNSSSESIPRRCRGNAVVHQYNRQINRSDHISNDSSTSHYYCH